MPESCELSHLDRPAGSTATCVSTQVCRCKLDRAILSLALNPRPTGTKRLKGKLHEGWRIRVGSYRILYKVDDDAREVSVFDIGHRREIYR